MKVFITGGTGFIGSRLAIASQEKGYEVELLGQTNTQAEQENHQLLEKHGIRSVIPEREDREYIHRVIVDELSVGNIRDSSREGYIRIIRKLSDKGADGIILGCTEIPLLDKSGDCRIPLFDTTEIHAEAAVSMALST